ncbi:indeterminate(ID)-domain 5 [Actinidia rufa]|uniref:Indeterminate(ID)-domain 5 n=1 Tax=Actinidia rufa TaxID=165716 RepID=A0A7J0FJI3_9ERIC|nr:indeterminate(ID)-domain 5 [Actinidia rufa]
MGATSSNNINSPMMQKSFGSTMAGPYSATQQHSSSYEHFQTPPDQSALVGINGRGFSNPMNDVGMFGGMEELQWVSLMGPSRFRGHSGGGGIDKMTVDFLGIGGPRPRNWHEQQQQQQQRLELEETSGHRTQVMNHFQEQLSQGETAMEKSMWDV